MSEPIVTIHVTHQPSVVDNLTAFQRHHIRDGRDFWITTAYPRLPTARDQDELDAVWEGIADHAAAVVKARREHARGGRA